MEWKNEYKIICKSSLSELENRVNIKLKEGWKCQGGISASEELSFCYGDMYNSKTYYYQVIRLEQAINNLNKQND